MTPLLNALIPIDAIRATGKPQGRDYINSRNNAARRPSSERIEVVCTRLALRVLHVARADFSQGRYERFDGNPGDSQCQVRAADVYAMAQNKEEILRELDSLCLASGLPLNADYSGKGISGIAKQINTMCCSQNENNLSGIREQLNQLRVSSQVQLLLQIYLSEIMRDVAEVLPSGTVVTAGRAVRLDRIETGLNAFPDTQKAILEYNQRELSQNSFLYLQSLMPNEDFYPRIVDTIEGNVVPTRTFSCLFSTTKSALELMNRSCGVICLRQIVPKLDRPIDTKRCQRQNSRDPEELFFKNGEQISKPKSKMPVMVIEANIPDMQEAASYIKINGLTNAILAQAAICPPFQRGSTPDDLPEQIREEAKALAAQQPPFVLDHYFVEEINQNG